jgi:filamentous hemagglutinin family protein
MGMVDSVTQGTRVRVLTQAVRAVLRGVSLAATASLFVSTVHADPLPVICVSGATCGNSNSVINNALQGVSGIAIAGNSMTINQNAANAVLHWRSFDIERGAGVTFVQPDSNSVALNRIYQNGASQIMGNLSANGRIYLLNQNGIMFGNGAVVNVAGLIASSLDISSLALNADGSTNLLAAGQRNEAAFRLYRDAGGNALTSGDVTVGQGASITTRDGGQVFMFAPNVYNYGKIATPDGQTVLAAGDSVYLASSADNNLRGIWVEVGTGGTVVNGVEANSGVTDKTQLVGQIIAERGNITLAGAAVNQLGRLTATTSVNEGGSIRLVAREDGFVQAAAGTSVTLTARTGGTLVLGSNSVTEVGLDNSTATTVDSNPQPVSRVVGIGRQIVMQDNASIITPHGDVTLAACADCSSLTDVSLAKVHELADETSSSSDGSRLFIAAGALIDVSGAHIEKTMESNVLRVELRGDELADSELQRDGALRGETVYIDIRQTGTRADGSTWVGSPVGDLGGWVGGIQRNVQERSLTGGTVNLLSRGDAILERGSTIDISGGSINFAGGHINTSNVIGADGKVYDISRAIADRSYVGVTNSGTHTVFDRRWGVTRTYFTGGTQGRYEQGYVEGKDAGTVQIIGSQTVLDGAIRAETVAGRYQRELSGTVNASALYRPYDELALSGTLILGKTSASGDQADFAVGDVTIANGAFSALAADFDPLTDSLGDIGSTVVLRSDLFGADRVGNLTLRANGAVTIAPDANVTLSSGGAMNVTAGAIDVGGSVTSHGGQIALTARPTFTTPELDDGLVVRSGARLDTSGTWVNDAANANGGSVGTAPLSIDGGSVRLQAQRSSLALETGSVIDVSGGAQLTGDGKLIAGEAGSIELTNTQSLASNGAVTTLTLDGELRGYGFENGGSLSLTTAGACIAATVTGCEQTSAGTLWLRPEFFASGGFSGYSILSNRGGIEVAADTTVTLRQQNWLVPLSGDLSRFATGTSIDRIATTGLLEDIERQAVDLELWAEPTRPGSDGRYTDITFADAPDLIIRTGARIEGEVGATIDLSSTSRLLIDGTVSAAAGTIKLGLSGGLAIEPTSANPYFADQGIWLGNNAQLLARGAAVTEVDSQGRVIGEVRNGGTIAIDADRGHVITSSGSLIDVSGTSAALSVKSDKQGHYQVRQVASAGGRLDIEAAEAILIGGDIRGESGDPGRLAAGTLRIALDMSLRNDPGLSRAFPANLPLFPGGDRTIEITQRPLDISFGDSTLVGYQGRAVVAADQIAEGGFDALELDATTVWVNEGGLSPNVVHTGRIEFDGDVSLALARSAVLNAAIVASDGGNAVLSAPRVTLGNSKIDLNNVQYQPPTLAGTGTLRVDAGQIDVIGSSVLQGFASTTLRSSGDLRLTGVLIDPLGDQGLKVLQGSLRTAGDLTLSAAQVYPTTMSEFTVAAGVGGTDGTLRIEQNGVAGDALSAGGALTLSAPNVVQSGTVRAPFGTITIDSPSITLADGSVTSTSGAGLDVLYGETEGGLNWVYVLGGDKIVYGANGRQISTQRIELNGDNVALEEGAVLDVSGGGNLLATEFNSGTTGKQDVLGKDNTAGNFAILPANSLAAAAYDETIYTVAEFEGGKSVYLSGTKDLPAGEYIVLPAKYALLPGAYLVRPVSGYGDITAAESYSLADGSNVVSGYYTYTGSGLRDGARTSGFAVLKGTQVQNKARYTLANANEFFAPPDGELLTQRLPKDAGTVAITATESLILQGTLQADVAQGGRGAALDIASSAIQVVADAGNAGNAGGALVLDAADLNALGAESILLGGVRQEDGQGLDIDTRSSNVSIAAGAALQAPEVMLVATDTVTVQQNASVTATGVEVRSQDIHLSGDGAFVRVATGEAANVARTNSTNNGRVVLADGSTLTATSGSISLESAGDAQLAGALSAVGGEVSMTGNVISLGNVDPSVSGWVLDAAQLSQLDAGTLSLNSRSTIDWYGNVSLALTNLSLSARAIRGYDDGAVSIAASGDVAFRGGGALIDPVDSVAGGQFHLTANNVIFDDGALELSGFDSVALLAAREVRAEQTTTVSIVGGGLQLGAQRITTRSGVDLSITAGGTATLSNSASTQALAAVNDLGGSFTLNANAIELATRIELPSGLVTLNATEATQGGITLSGNAAIDVSGRSTQLGDQVAYSHGGKVNLETVSGNLALAAGSSIDVSANGGANAGSIELTAANGNLQLAGTLDGSAEGAGSAGSFSGDAQQLGDFSALTQQLASSGFAGDLSFRQRGAGDLTVASGATVRGTSVSMTADQGSVVVAGGIVAHDDDGGRINLSARNGMTISGTLDARATGTTERNGRIDLNVTNGGLNVTNGAVIATVASGARQGSSGDGDVSIRLPQSSLLTVIDADIANDAVHLGGDWSRTADVSVEGFAVHVDADGILDGNDTVAMAGNAIYDAAVAFAARTDEIATALSNPSLTGLDVLTGIEIQSGASDGSLSLNADWNMAAWRFADASGGAPKSGVLTLRAAGNLTFNESLSDGFSDQNDFTLDLDPNFGDSWSYNLVAGADTASANVMATQASNAVGSVLINGVDSSSEAGYTVVRTGTGSIDVAAASDIVLSNDAAMIYTAGEASNGMIYGTVRGQGNQLGGFYYPANGGDITLTAGRDVIGTPTRQLLTEWLWRIGKDSETTGNPSRSTAWTVNFAKFHQGIGALAGGDVSVTAGNDVRDLSVASTTIGRQRTNPTNDKTAAANDLEVIGGGNVRVASGGDVLGGTYYSGRGQIELQAGGEVGKSQQTSFGPMLLLGDTQAKVAARQDVSLGGVATPTLLPQGTTQGSLASTDSMFSTYSAQSSLTVESTAGDVSLVPDKGAINDYYAWSGNNANQSELAFTLLPGTVDMLALRGGARVTGTLLPNENGALSVHAYQDVDFDVIVSDVDVDALPDQDRPAASGAFDRFGSDLYTALTQWNGNIKQIFNAQTPVRQRAAEAGTLLSSRIVSANGDVKGSGYFGAPVDIQAGGDIVDLDVVIQNLVAADVSAITAGGDIRYTTSSASGGLAPNNAGIRVDGPGQLFLIAGGDIDLATSQGVITRGNEVNLALPEGGASITALAGLNGESPDYAAFAEDYVAQSDDYIAALTAYIETLTGDRPANATEARAAFTALNSKQQRAFLYRVLLSEVRESAEEAASVEMKDDYSRGFAALETLFPGSTDAEDNPYSGDISLYFSRIYTLDGGDINLLTPGGGVNAGLSAATLERFRITKDSSELGLVTRRGGDIGIVTDGDVLVNESRIFAINDSDIVVWSSNGDVDAGRGAKTAISAPTFAVAYDLDGRAHVTYDAALSGSGIQTRATTADHKPGDVVLAAPRGVVNAGDAGIVAGNLTIAATAVLGADNISVSGIAVGVPVDTGGLGASLAGVASAASSASNSAATAVDDTGSREQSSAPMSQAALSWLDVFVIGLGEEGCKGDDVECLKRQSTM